MADFAATRGTANDKAYATLVTLTLPLDDFFVPALICYIFLSVWKRIRIVAPPLVETNASAPSLPVRACAVVWSSRGRHGRSP